MCLMGNYVVSQAVTHIINSFRSILKTCRCGVVVGASNAAAAIASSLLGGGYGMNYYM